MTSLDLTTVALALFHGVALLGLVMVAVALRRSGETLDSRIALAALLLGGGTLVVAQGVAFAASRFLGLRLAGHLLFGYLPLGLLLVAWLGKRYSARRRWFTAGLATLVLTVAVWAFVIEPQLLEVEHYLITSPEIGEPLRIVVMADFQTDHMGAFERRALRALMAEQPDMILWPGDYLQTSAARWPELAEEFNASLHAVGLSAPLGVYASDGDTDPASWPSLFDGLPVQVTPGSTTVMVGDRGVTVTALSVAVSRFGARLAPAEGFHVVFGHAPDFALYDVAGADLLIAGHTHGGQVRLPFIGPLLTLSRVPRAWAAGHTRLQSGADLFVSRGIGMERGHAPRLRFLCRPELMVIDVLPETDTR